MRADRPSEVLAPPRAPAPAGPEMRTCRRWCGGGGKDDGWRGRRGRLLQGSKLISRQMFLSAVKNGMAKTLISAPPSSLLRPVHFFLSFSFVPHLWLLNALNQPKAIHTASNGGALQRCADFPKAIPPLFISRIHGYGFLYHMLDAFGGVCHQS